MDTKFEAEPKEEAEKKWESKGVIKEIFSWIFVLVAAFVLAYFITNHVIVWNQQLCQMIKLLEIELPIYFQSQSGEILLFLNIQMMKQKTT